MVISPIKAGALEPVIEEALAQASQASERLKPYSELSDDQKTATQQLCYFLAFSICEEINDRVGPEIEAMMYRTGGGGSGTDHYLVKISAANTGIVYDIGGNSTVDLSTTSIYTSTTVVTMTPHVDYRAIVTEN